MWGLPVIPWEWNRPDWAFAHVPFSYWIMVQIWSGGGNFAVFQLHFVYSDNFPTLDLFFIIHPGAILWKRKARVPKCPEMIAGYQISTETWGLLLSRFLTLVVRNSYLLQSKLRSVSFKNISDQEARHFERRSPKMWEPMKKTRKRKPEKEPMKSKSILSDISKTQIAY